MKLPKTFTKFDSFLEDGLFEIGDTIKCYREIGDERQILIKIL